jgi:hypothetical protein
MNNSLAGNDDEDGFWRLALMSLDDQQPRRLEEHQSDICSDDCDENIQRLKTYSLPSNIKFTVSSLEENEGIMSPLGSQAWHASSLLAAYIILKADSLFKSTNTNHIKRCLELGSGAVGLSGMTLAAVLSNMYPPGAKVILTDLESETGVLNNLQENVKRNMSMFPNVGVDVQALDWNDFVDNKRVSESRLRPLDLVMGSELVYTPETAVACGGVVAHLLHNNPNLLVLIIQVTDRPGFETHFLPLLQKKFNVRVEQPLDSELYDVASGIVVDAGGRLMGGTLDRFAYGACWISSTTKLD